MSFRPEAPRSRGAQDRKSLHHALTALLLVALTLMARQSSAAPQATILRIDPRASTGQGEPILNTVVEVAQGLTSRGLIVQVGRVGAGAPSV